MRGSIPVVLLASTALLLSLVPACSGSLVRQSERSLQHRAAELELRPATDVAPTFDGTLAGYLAFALQHSPVARAAFERWRSRTLRIAKAQKWPEPNLTFGYFVRSVETRVGPQRFRIGLSQDIPWPSQRAARAHAVAARARADESAFQSELVTIRHRVARHYWHLWMLRAQHRLKREHDAVLESLAEAVRGRIRTGAATLAELSQVELDITRHHDHRDRHVLAARQASALLGAAIGIDGPGQTLAASDTPAIGLPGESDEVLRAAARAHPDNQRYTHLAASARHRASAERTERYPRIRLGLDYIVTGAAATETPDSGKDPLVVMAAVSLPLWAGVYRDAERSAHAAAAAHEAEREAAILAASASAEVALAEVRDTLRRVQLFRTTLLPQGRATFQSVLGDYQSGRSSVSAVILAQRDLLELQLEHVAALAAHAIAWAQLEAVVGRPIAERETVPEVVRGTKP